MVMEVGMSLQAKPGSRVPAETARVARAAFPKGNPYLTLRDELDTIYPDNLFAPLFPTRGQPAEARASVLGETRCALNHLPRWPDDVALAWAMRRSAITRSQTDRE